MDRTAYDRYWRLEERHFWRVGRRRLLLEVLERHLPARGSSGGRPRILDVGGACALVTRELGRLGDVTMVEPDEATADFARRELGLDVRVGSLPDRMPVDGPFDVITLLDVIEHIDDDLAALRAVWSLLRPGGTLLITVPAMAWLWSDHDVSVHHRRRYVEADLRPLMAAAGFTVERMSYFTSLLFPLIAAQRLALRARGIKAKAEYQVSVPPGPVNSALLGVMDLERRLLRRRDLPIGSSLLAVGRRPAAP